MVTKRIIPCLDIRNGRVVKGVNFKGVQDVEDPVALARRYNDAGADELVFYDITASVEGRGLFTDVLRDVARQIDVYKRQGHSRRARGRLRLCVRKPARYARLRKKPGHRLDRPHGYGPVSYTHLAGTLSAAPWRAGIWARPSISTQAARI